MKLTCLYGASQRETLHRPDYERREDRRDARLQGHQKKTSPSSIKAKVGHTVAWPTIVVQWIDGWLSKSCIYVQIVWTTENELRKKSFTLYFWREH